MGGRDQAPAALTSDRPGTYYTRGWTGREASVNATENLANTVIGSSDLPAHSKPLHRHRYPKVTHAVTIKLEVITTLNVTVSSSIFSHGATTPCGPGPPHCRLFTITFRHTTLGRTPLDERSARRRDL